MNGSAIILIALQRVGTILQEYYYNGIVPNPPAGVTVIHQSAGVPSERVGNGLRRSPKRKSRE